ncbi:DUF397 domain-containing protein [Streptomyces sp. W16]|uniref:DUF397 domain-containing protein n=1 Tax=Streptomyces sp. W16 TaxID=3076631 RepID=UPI00295B92DC|nr:DUF397 domain-containing protein [Streptomyces sp. W16]MDV9169831.1 DUF397 domain-containing protein [Streptomyces sp. W16]
MTRELDQGAYNWHKSSYSAEQNECVEAGQLPASSTAAVALRDTKAKGTGSVLAFTSEAWQAFLGLMK